MFRWARASRAAHQAARGSTRRRAFHEIPRPALDAACRWTPYALLAAGLGTVSAFGGAELAQTPALGPNFIVDAAEKVMPAVVNITCGGGQGPMSMSSSGSGFILSKEGLIVTNAHVVRMGGGLTVTLADGRRLPGRIHSVDDHSDIALVKVESDSPLPVVTIGESRALRPGEWVVAVGSPLTLSNTVTAGIVSAVNRNASDLGLARQRTEYIQTDAAINVGNSGGPLVNLKGEVVGINNMKAQGAGGISFAIPIDTAVQVINQLRSQGSVQRPWLGIRIVTLDERMAEAERQRDPNFPKSVKSGVMVVMVEPNSPAEEAGLRPGDVLVWFDRHPVRQHADVTDRVGYEVGRTIEVEVKRGSSGSKRCKITTRALPTPRR